MLAHTANCLYWLARSVERMDCGARLLDTAQRMAAVAPDKRGSEWQSALIASGCEPAFFEQHTAASRASVVRYMTQDDSNPSSIWSCLNSARQNARAVRTAITSDMWEAINGAWIEARGWQEEDFGRDRLGESLDWVKRQATLFNGAYRNTMLRTDAYHFTHLGAHIERADNTARILDVKYHVLLPNREVVGGAVDAVQWTAILRSVSGRRAYQHLYRNEINPWQVAELLILRPEMPRSLRSCYQKITETLGDLASDYQGQVGDPHEHAEMLHNKLRFRQIEEIFQAGLHEFLTDYVDETAVLGDKIHRFYHMV